MGAKYIEVWCVIKNMKIYINDRVNQSIDILEKRIWRRMYKFKSLKNGISLEINYLILDTI